MTDASFRFRIATPDDAPALLAIYAPYVENTAISFEYVVPSVEEFRSRIEGVRKSYPYLVAEAADGSLLGYAYTHTFIPRAAYDHCAETTIYLALDARHQGLGKRLYRALEELSLAQNIYNLYACIGEPQGEGDEYLTWPRTRTMSVSMTPGATQFTRMPEGASSMARDRVRAMMPALVQE